MKRLIALILAMTIVGMNCVLANWVMPTAPVLPTQIVEPVLPTMPEQVYIGPLTGTFEFTGMARGGWYYNGGWALEDLQHPTAIDYLTGTTTGSLVTVLNYRPSGTEASGDAWKYASQGYVSSAGPTTVDSQVSSWSVNPVPPGGGYTTFFTEESNFIGGYLASSVVVSGTANGNSLSPTIVQTHFETASPFIQQRVVKIN